MKMRNVLVGFRSQHGAETIVTVKTSRRRKNPCTHALQPQTPILPEGADSGLPDGFRAAYRAGSSPPRTDEVLSSRATGAPKQAAFACWGGERGTCSPPQTHASLSSG